MKSQDELKELRALSAEELAAKIDSYKEELMKLRFQHATGQQDNTARFRSLRKSVARAKTLIREL